jgi:6-phosphogluconate dehydrogenase
LNRNDIIIDGGNSHFTDTERRSTSLEKKRIHFFGMGFQEVRKVPEMARA